MKSGKYLSVIPGKLAKEERENVRLGLDVNGNVFCLCNPGYFGTQCTTATGTTTKNPVCVNNPCNNGNIKIILY